MSAQGDAIEDTMERYDINIERYRTKEDFLWRFLKASEANFQQPFLDDICRHLRDQYGNPHAKFKMSEENLQIIEWAAKHSKNQNLKHCIWFFALYLFPAMTNWIVKGNESAPGPALHNPHAFLAFVSNILPKLCNELLSGKGGMNIDTFVRTARTELIVTTGLPVPPISLRLEHENANRLAHSKEQQRIESGSNDTMMLEY